jgi:hypothetical protein
MEGAAVGATDEEDIDTTSFRTAEHWTDKISSAEGSFDFRCEVSVIGAGSAIDITWDALLDRGKSLELWRWWRVPRCVDACGNQCRDD